MLRNLLSLFDFQNKMVIGNLRNLVCLVSGGAQGLGRGCAERFLREGAKVVVVDLPGSNGASIIPEIGPSDQIVFNPGDITLEDDVRSTVELCRDKFGRLDVLVNCAATHCAFATYNFNKRRPHELADFEKIMKTNPSGNINLVKHAVGLMAKNDPSEDGYRGTVINVGGLAAIEGTYGQVANAAAKGAVHSMTLPLAREFAAVGIRVNCIAPGQFETPLMAPIPDKIRKLLEDLTPHPARYGLPDEFAHLCQTIVENPMLNGATIRLDGAIRVPQ